MNLGQGGPGLMWYEPSSSPKVTIHWLCQRFRASTEEHDQSAPGGGPGLIWY